jgi:3-hydroxymyristoyl/3-hydroxydecanoyl-(acyl carrier protein) dehydratase
MAETYTHNPRLPSVQEVLALNRVLLLDGVQRVELGSVTGYWVARDEICRPAVKDGIPLVPSTLPAEMFNQLAGYHLLHGQEEHMIPYLTQADEFRWRHIVKVGDPIQVQVDVEKARGTSREYVAKGSLIVDNELACSGLIRGALLRLGESWIAPIDPSENRAEARPFPQPRKNRRVIHERKGGLYERIIDIDEIPQQDKRPRETRVEVSVVNNNRIQFEDRVVNLSGDRLFVLNALLLNLGRPVTRVEVEDLGLLPGGSPTTRQVAFSNAKDSLKRNLTVGDPPRELLLEEFKEQRRGYYQLDPNIEYVFYDRRQQEN